MSLWSKVLWATGFLLNVALVFVLFYKRRYRTVPWFTAWITGEAVYTASLFLGLRLGSMHTYVVMYWTADFLDVLLQIAVVLEIARYVLRRSGRWIAGSRVRITIAGATAPVVAFLMAWFMKPAAHTRLGALAAQSSLFTTILVCGLFTAVVFTSQQLGLGLRSHVMRETYGFILWSLVAFVTDTLHAYWATISHFTAVEDVKIVVFQASLIYWAIGFWLPEPQPAQISASEKFNLEQVRSRLEYAKSHKAPTGVLPK